MLDIMDAPKISGARIHKLTTEIDDTIQVFLEKNLKTTNEELHLALHRVYQMRELQPIIMLTKAYQEQNDGNSSYIK